MLLWLLQLNYFISAGNKSNFHVCVDEKEADGGRGMMRKKKKMDVAKELSELVYLQTVKFKGEGFQCNQND